MDPCIDARRGVLFMASRLETTEDVDQCGKNGTPGEQIWATWKKNVYFADFRNESEYKDGKFPVAQIYSQRQLVIWRREQSVLDSKRSRE